MIGIVIISLAALVALVYVAAPLGRKISAVGVTDGLEEEAESRKRAALGALVDIEDEREMGKLASGDFEALKDDYEAQALTALAELDTLTAAREGSERALEEEIAAVRRRLTCPSCGGPLPKTSEGTTAQGQEAGRCPRCGAG